MYKRGTKVRFNIQGSNYNLTYNKIYTIKSSFYNKNNNFIVQVVNDLNKFMWVNIKYFIVDITEERKQKLKNIHN